MSTEMHSHLNQAHILDKTSDAVAASVISTQHPDHAIGTTSMHGVAPPAMMHSYALHQPIPVTGPAKPQLSMQDGTMHHMMDGKKSSHYDDHQYHTTTGTSNLNQLVASTSNIHQNAHGYDTHHHSLPAHHSNFSDVHSVPLHMSTHQIHTPSIHHQISSPHQLGSQPVHHNITSSHVQPMAISTPIHYPLASSHDATSLHHTSTAYNTYSAPVSSHLPMAVSQNTHSHSSKHHSFHPTTQTPTINHYSSHNLPSQYSTGHRVRSAASHSQTMYPATTHGHSSTHTPHSVVSHNHLPLVTSTSSAAIHNSLHSQPSYLPSSGVHVGHSQSHSGTISSTQPFTPYSVVPSQVQPHSSHVHSLPVTSHYSSALPTHTISHSHSTGGHQVTTSSPRMHRSHGTTHSAVGTVSHGVTHHKHSKHKHASSAHPHVHHTLHGTHGTTHYPPGHHSTVYPSISGVPQHSSHTPSVEMSHHTVHHGQISHASPISTIGHHTIPTKIHHMNTSFPQLNTSSYPHGHSAVVSSIHPPIVDTLHNKSKRSGEGMHHTVGVNTRYHAHEGYPATYSGMYHPEDTHMIRTTHEVMGGMKPPYDVDNVQTFEAPLAVNSKRGGHQRRGSSVSSSDVPKDEFVHHEAPKKLNEVHSHRSSRWAC